MTDKTILFRGSILLVTLKKYPNKRNAIELIDTEDGMPFMKATINLPDAIIADDEVIIKDYSENEGIYPVLVEAGVISPLIRMVNTRYVNGIVCKLLVS